MRCIGCKGNVSSIRCLYRRPVWHVFAQIGRDKPGPGLSSFRECITRGMWLLPLVFGRHVVHFFKDSIIPLRFFMR